MAAASTREALLVQWGEGLEGSKAFPDIRTGESEEAGAAADGDVVLLFLELPELPLNVVELSVELVVLLDLTFKAPISHGAGLLHDVGEDGGVGRDTVNEPSGEGVRDGVGDE